MNWHAMTEEDVLQRVESNENVGLSNREASARLAEFGTNELSEQKPRSPFSVFVSQFNDFMIFILLAATLISGLLGEYIDAITILIIVFINGCLGFFQERKAERSLLALKKLSAPEMTVLREGSWVKIPSRDVVVGDVVKCSTGDRIGADVRFIETSRLAVEESALTGESVPVQKAQVALEEEDINQADKTNMGFMGTLVTSGQGKAVVVATGMNTEMGKIAHLMSSESNQITPLQKRLEELGKVLIAGALVLTALVVLFGIYQGHELYTMVLAGVSLAVAAIPEGLPAIVTIALALGVQRMIKRNAIVRRLPAVETLGCATVVCSDKTGTLTKNEMTVTQLWSVDGTIDMQKGDGSLAFTNDDSSQRFPKTLRRLLYFGTLCTEADITKPEQSAIDKLHAHDISGDPTEVAMVVASAKAGFDKRDIVKDVEIEKVFPFDSKRKMMSMVVKDKQTQKRYVVAKGAPDVLTKHARAIETEKGQEKLTSSAVKQVEEAVEEMAQAALRTIAVGYRELRENEKFVHESEAEQQLTLVGIEGMIDPPRPEVKQAITNSLQAGVRTVMITGDHRVTAEAIAKQIGLLPDGGRVMDGRELDEMSVRDLKDIISDVYVFARVSPEHKLKIVKALQQNGEVVAMTGDGVNDAPAIKASNIGVAMGITGTDVAKEASSLILRDDHFATIQAAIKEGRNIYDNIRKFIRYMLASNVGEILVMLFAMMLGMPLPLVAIQILWINLVTDGLPAMALGMDKPESDVMKRKPRDTEESIFARGLGWKVISRGFMIGVVTLIAFWWMLEVEGTGLQEAQTVAFATLVMAQLIHVFDCRSEYSVFHRNPFGNLYLIGAVLSSVVLLLLVIYVPAFQPIFHTVSLTFNSWLFILAMAALPTVALAGGATIRRKR
ncbi:cation-translocating P-type ATPase [Texcoconibacillus texcoconensis]|uniref:Ca2+-transporting ATPase n=1 Tax=Texcoconibacillus texcoconensis TaxID=1095777 RepID=A0A840QLA0_9BACI|nr:cation-translocating P-type ATPase [Texcoconibacillus texcoconensis]MBB5172138.1 Ca2+-transporting ATPase [Texcoconibacillus texcoconensis]